MDQLTHTNIYMEHLEQLLDNLHLDEETKKELMEKHIEEYKGLPGSPRPKKKRKLNEQGDYVVTKSLELLKRKRNKNRRQHQENTVVPSVFARNN
jgi:hypothetical protein